MSKQPIQERHPGVKFLHYRERENGSWLSRGGRTFAYKDQGNGSFKVAVSKCHYNDNFNKNLARERAAGRLNSRDEALVTVIPGTYEDVLNYCETDATNYGFERKFAGKPKAELTASQTGLVL